MGAHSAGTIGIAGAGRQWGSRWKWRGFTEADLGWECFSLHPGCAHEYFSSLALPRLLRKRSMGVLRLCPPHLTQSIFGYF